MSGLTPHRPGSADRPAALRVRALPLPAGPQVGRLVEEDLQLVAVVVVDELLGEGEGGRGGAAGPGGE